MFLALIKISQLVRWDIKFNNNKIFQGEIFMQRKLSLLMVIALAVVMLVAGCSSNDKGPDAEKDTFRVGLEADYHLLTGPN